MSYLSTTALPFLYLSLQNTTRIISKPCIARTILIRRCLSTQGTKCAKDRVHSPPETSHVNPTPEDYGRTIFADKCTLSVFAGGGGHGCVSFQREKYIAAGPANGGDGGTGGSIYIKAVKDETSLHKIARRGAIRAGRGENGLGKSKGGQRGADVLLQVPVGTVVREISRIEPGTHRKTGRPALNQGDNGDIPGQWRRDKWVVYPTATPSEFSRTEFPRIPKYRVPDLSHLQPPAPISLDLSQHMEKPMLLVAGAIGGLGNPHFVTDEMPKPKIATKGEKGVAVTLELELKLLADVGFVGMPNAGKSTLLRAMSKSRSRVGDWAFTTLHPSIGTVVLDDHHGRPKVKAYQPDGTLRTQISIADIPGLVSGAHLDKGLGHSFLRHVERAKVLGFVVDLSGQDAVAALKELWHELREFELAKDAQFHADTQRLVDWRSHGTAKSPANLKYGDDSSPEVLPPTRKLPELKFDPISSKPWFVVATKADVEGTQQNFDALQSYLKSLLQGMSKHPSGKNHAWRGPLNVIPVSAMRGEGVERIPEWVVGLLDRS